MSPLAVLGIAVLSAAVAALALVLVRFNRKRLHIARRASSASPEQLERIYTLVEQLGTVAAVGCVLARTNRVSGETRCLIPVPNELAAFPWAGRVIEAKVSKEVDFQFVEADVLEPTLLGHVYRPVRVPRHQTKEGVKERNTFSPERYFGSSTALVAALEAVCPEHPQELLSYLLCIGRNSFEFEPIDQARIGTSPAWVQDPEHQTCEECKKRMQLVLQLPGTVLSKKAFHRGTFYLFGCLSHPHRTKTLGQFT
jgi:hypothetical protein